MKKWREQIDELPIPFPQKHQLRNEIEDHLHNTDSSEEDAFDDHALAEFVLLHNPAVLLYLRRVPVRVRNVIEFSTLGAPLAGLLIYLIKEDFMVHFLINGGVSMIPILALGLFMLGREGLLLLRLVLLKDHGGKNLHLDSNSVLIGAFALVVIGLAATGLGAYVSISFALSSHASTEVIVAGVGESITNIIVSASFAALILLMHYTTRSFLRRWHAPISE